MNRRIVVNGVEYERLEDVPEDVRRMLQHELPDSYKAAPSGRSAPAAKAARRATSVEFSDSQVELPPWVRVESVAARQARLRRAWLIVGALLFVALAALAFALLLPR